MKLQRNHIFCFNYNNLVESWNLTLEGSLRSQNPLHCLRGPRLGHRRLQRALEQWSSAFGGAFSCFTLIIWRDAASLVLLEPPPYPDFCPK